MKTTNPLAILTALLIMGITTVRGQGDGPRMLLWGPTGVTGVIVKWMDMDQNILPANILVKDAKVRIDAFPITVVHNFGINGRFAQVMLAAVPGKVKGTLTSSPPGIPNPSLSANGFADGFIGFKLGLVHQPALNVKEMLAYQHKRFSMFSYLRIWYPGSYDEDKAINLGSNRFTFEWGPSLNFYLGNNPKRPFWLESYPAIHLFTPNNSPTKVTQADQTKQLPLFSWENHLSRSFTDKFWASIDLRYQYGGALKEDGVEQDNTINALGGGITAGYQVLAPLSIHAFYGTVLTTGSDVESDMFKLTVVFSYVNLKKLQQAGN